jgi:hypothetical protein
MLKLQNNLLPKVTLSSCFSQIFLLFSLGMRNKQDIAVITAAGYAFGFTNG